MPALFDWPSDIRPSSFSFWLEANTAKMESPLNRAQQIIVRQGSRWRCDMTLERKNRFVAARIDGMLAELEGSAGQVYLWDFRRETPQLYTPATVPPLGSRVLTDNAAKGATAIAVGGWLPSQLVLMAGDYFHLNGYLYMMTQNAHSDGAGVAALYFKPGLRLAVPVGTALKFQYAQARFRLADNGQGMNSTDAAIRSTYNLSFYEAIP